MAPNNPPASRPQPPLIPRETLFGNPTKASPLVSPDGTRMAYLAPVDGVLNVWVGSIEAEDYQPVTQDRDRGVRIYFWGFDGHTIYHLQDVGGDEDWCLYATDLGTGETTSLTPFEGVQVKIVAYRKQFPTDMIIAINKDDPAAHDAYHLDLSTRKLSLVGKNPGNIIGWLADADLRVRGAVSANADAGFDLLVRQDQDAEWRTLISWSRDDSLTSGPKGFTRDGTGLYLADSRQHNAARLVQMDIATGETTALAQDPHYDVGPAMMHPDTRQIQAVGFVRERLEWEVLDPSIEADFQAIAGLHPGDFAVYDRTMDDKIWLVGFTHDAGPVSYYAFDRTKRQERFLFSNHPELADAVLAPMAPIEFTARDGLTIHGYVTRPVEDGAELPMVLNVHGGPWHRDTWGYDPEAQWLANRGYVCLQVNFRGSTGYGKDFLNAGDREWGGRMHDDLIDAVQWAVERRIADPKRIAIYGGSYGGYAALVGATFTPNIFCCAVDIVGPSNLITFIKTVPAYWESFLQMLYDRLGHPERDAEFLRERSPLFRVNDIGIPLLIAQGANDPRVKQAESEQIVEAMKQNGIEHEYLLFPDEGHGFVKPENRLKFYAAAEKFLVKYLGGRCEDS